VPARIKRAKRKKMRATIGVDTLGGVKYPEVIAKLPKKYATGFFYEEFGDARKLIQKEAKSGRAMLRIQGLWAGSSHNYGESHRKRSLQIAKELSKIAVATDRIIYYSPFCEHKKDAAYMSKLLNEIDLLPNLIPVNSPISGGQWVTGFINEIHHNDKPAGMPKGQYIFSMDGLHQPNCNIEIYKAKYLNDPNCIAFYVWALQHNCKPNSKPESNIPPKQRQTKPSPDLDKSLIFQIENAKQKVSLAKGWTAKTHSEQHKPVEPTANKFVLVTPKGVACKRVKVGKYDLRDGGFYTDSGQKRQTWRSNFWAYKAGRVVQVIADGKLIGTIDLPFREGDYKEKT
jgi:hypothetical protein